jgi:hypothetical protein
MNQQNFSNYINTTTIADWTPQWFTQTHWSSPTTFRLPEYQTPDMNQYAIFYFLSGAIFFLGSACMVLSAPRSPSFTALDGIAKMSDFTKNNGMNSMRDYVPKRELIALLESNGMDAEEFLTIFAGKNKRSRRSLT